MSIKLIAVDIDGTLVNSQKEITPEVFSAIQDAKEAGVKVVIATGRPIAGVRQTSGQLAVERQRVTMSSPSTVPLSKKLLLAMRLSANP